MATIAVVGVAAAATAYSAYSASAAAKKGSKSSSTTTTQLPLWGKMFNRGTADLLDESRRVMEDAAQANNLVTPEIWAALGYDPVYDDRGGLDVSAAGKQFDDAQKALAESRTKQGALQNQKRDLARQLRDSQRTEKGATPEERQALRAKRSDLRKQIADTTREISRTVADIPLHVKTANAAGQALGDAQTQPRRIIGLKPRENGPTDPTGSKDNLFRVAADLENETLVRALQGKEPIDATLQTAFEEKERTLRERLRRQMGPDYETSTAGQQALANFDRERAEAFQQFNTDTVKNFSAMTEARAAALSNLTSARIQQLTYPVNQQAGIAASLGNIANDRTNFGNMLSGNAPKTSKGTQGGVGDPTGEAVGQIGQGLGGVAAGGGIPTTGTAAALGNTTRNTGQYVNDLANGVGQPTYGEPR